MLPATNSSAKSPSLLTLAPTVILTLTAIALIALAILGSVGVVHVFTNLNLSPLLNSIMVKIGTTPLLTITVLAGTSGLGVVAFIIYKHINKPTLPSPTLQQNGEEPSLEAQKPELIKLKSWEEMPLQEQAEARRWIKGGLQARIKLNKDREISAKQTEREMICIFNPSRKCEEGIFLNLNQQAVEGYCQKYSAEATAPNEFYALVDSMPLEILGNYQESCIQILRCRAQNLPKEKMQEVLQKCTQKYADDRLLLIEQAFYTFNSQKECEIFTPHREKSKWLTARQSILSDLDNLKSHGCSTNPSLQKKLGEGRLTVKQAQEKLSSLIGYLDTWIDALEKGQPSGAPSYFHATIQSNVEHLLNSEISVSHGTTTSRKAPQPGAFVSNFPEYTYGDIAFAFTAEIEWTAPFLQTSAWDDTTWLGFNAPIPINQSAKVSKQLCIALIMQQMEHQPSFPKLNPWKQLVLKRLVSKALDAHTRCVIKRGIFSSKPKMFILKKLKSGDGARKGEEMTKKTLSDLLQNILTCIGEDGSDLTLDSFKEELKTVTLPSISLPEHSFNPAICGIAVLDDETISDRSYFPDAVDTDPKYQPMTRSTFSVKYPQLAHLPCYTYLEIHLLRSYEKAQPHTPVSKKQTTLVR